MWDRIKAFCLNSATIAFGYFVAAIGFTLQLIDALASFYGDDAIKAQIMAIFGGNPVWAGRIMMGLSICFILARLRSLMRR